MKCCIAYASTHHGNTKKVVDAIAKEFEVDIMISEHYILQTKGKYPVLHSTSEGLHYSESITEGKLNKLKKYLETEVITWNN